MKTLLSVLIMLTAVSGAVAQEPPAASPAASPAAPDPGTAGDASGGQDAVPEARRPGRAGASVVLCYHHVEDPAKNEYTVTQADLEAQMAWLKKEGYNVVPLEKLVAAYRGQGTLPEKAVAITFDDGWRCANEKALPIFKKHGFPCTLFLYPDMVGPGKHKNSYDEYKAMLADPLVTIGGHSYSHPYLTKDGGKLKGADYTRFLQREYVQSKLQLEKKLGVPIKWLAYPYGLYDEQVARLREEAGYEAAFTVNGAANSALAGPMFLDRYMIMKSDGMKGFVRKVQSLPLELTELDPGNGALVPASRRTFSVKIVQPDVDPRSVQMTIGGKGKSTFDPTTGVARVEAAGNLSAKMHQITVQARDTKLGRFRRQCWFVRVRGAPAAPAVVREKRGKDRGAGTADSGGDEAGDDTSDRTDRGARPDRRPGKDVGGAQGQAPAEGSEEDGER
ncbi:MAG: polysaccharide deacetylase family protein [Candidatus Riflebacteria bacterium]|nr:polysaccharide deacetylase family protein [Candidatus Riflebacteria bacterium]